MSYDNIATKPEFNSRLIESVRNLPDNCGILELGSGYTTRLIVDNMKPSHYLVSLEESEQWYNDIIEKDPRMKHYVRHSYLVDVPIGRKKFYVDVAVHGFNGHTFSLVVADGPTGGHRWPGTFLIWPYLAHEYTILFDDTEREQYQYGIKLWQHSNFATEQETKIAVEWHDGWAIIKGKKC